MFNIKLDTTVRQLLPKLQHFGVIIAYKLDGQLMHSHKPTHEELMWVLMYAPDILLVNMQPDHKNFLLITGIEGLCLVSYEEVLFRPFGMRQPVRESILFECRIQDTMQFRIFRLQ